MAAVAGEFDGAARVVTICAAILVAFWGHAVASRMRTLLIFSHDVYNPPPVYRRLARKIVH